MKTIRICEESEARLLIRDGAFKDYVNTWSSRFPQTKPLPRIKEIHDSFGLPLKDAKVVADAAGLHDSVIFEVGGSVAIRKHHDDHEVYRKVGNIWVLREGGLDALDDEALFDTEPRTRRSLCLETEILRCKDAERLSCDVYRRLNCYDALFPFGDREIWEMKCNSNILIYSLTPSVTIISCSEEAIAKHIREYREKYKTAFGRF